MSLQDALGGDPGRVVVIAPPAARSRATRSSASSLIASVISPRSIIARASSNGTRRTAISSVPSGVASPAVRPVARYRSPASSVTELDRWTRRDLSPLGRLEAGLLAELAPGALEGVLAGGTPPSGISHD